MEGIVLLLWYKMKKKQGLECQIILFSLCFLVAKRRFFILFDYVKLVIKSKSSPAVLSSLNLLTF